MAALKPLSVHTFDFRDGSHFRVYKVILTAASDTLDIETAIPANGFAKFLDDSGATVTHSGGTLTTGSGTAGLLATLVVHYPGMNTSL